MTHDLTARERTDQLDALHAVLDGELAAHHQPIVDIDSGERVACEALTRLPAASGFANPDQLFTAARRHRQLVAVDLACARTAFATTRHLPPGAQLFVNIEPATLISGVDHLLRLPRPAAEVVIELTERALSVRPASLVEGTNLVREHGFRIALDDVGVNPDSLAYLPLLRPEVVKLDMGLIRNAPDRSLGRTMAGVLAYAERSGAKVLAEGIETDAHLERALSLGAHLGQGWRWGRAEPPVHRAGPTPPLRLPWFGVDAPAPSPFHIARHAGLTVREGSQRTLLQISHQVEALAHHLPDAICLAAFQHAERFTPDTHRRYRKLGERCALVAAFGVGLDIHPAPGVRGAPIAADDPLAGEWTVVVLGPQYASALIALDLERGEGADRRFAFTVTHDRAIVERVARHLVTRIDD